MIYTANARGCAVIVLHLDELLESRGMTVSELSERVGITRANMSKIKTGDAKALRFRRWMESVRFWPVSQAT